MVCYMNMVDMKAVIEAQAGTVVGKVSEKTPGTNKGVKSKRKGYIRINQPKK